MFPRFSPNYSFHELLHALLPAKKNSVQILEQRFAEKSSHKYALAYKYGRTALYYLIKALNIEGKKIIIPSYTCVVVANAIVKAGCIPVFLDNNKETYQPAIQDYLAAIDDDTAMVVITNLFGIAEESSEIYYTIKSKHQNVFVLQDCAHSYFCMDSEGEVVTKYGDGAIYGMNISKLVNSVKGGMLTLKDEGLYENVKQTSQLRAPGNSLISRLYVIIATFAFSQYFYKLLFLLQKKTKLLSKFTDYYSDSSIDLPNDYNIAMSDFEATIGLHSLNKYDKRVMYRKQIAQIYYEHLKNYTTHILKLPKFNTGNTWSHFPISVDVASRDAIISKLSRSYEIGIIVDYSIADFPSYKFASTTSTNASYDAKSVINLPLTFAEGLFASNDHQDCAKKFINEFIDLLKIRL